MKKIIITIFIFLLGGSIVYAKPIDFKVLSKITQQIINETNFLSIFLPVKNITTTFEEGYKINFEVDQIIFDKEFKATTTLLKVEKDIIKSYNFCRENGGDIKTCKKVQRDSILRRVKNKKDQIRREMEDLKSKDYSNEWKIEDFTFTKDELTNQ